MSTARPDEWQDVIDSRDLVKWLSDLEDADDPDITDDQDHAALVTEIKEVLSEIRQYAGDSPEDGVTLVRESYFRDYARELAEDCASFAPGDEIAKVLASWPYRHIDWDEAAKELKMDYTELTWRDITYLFM